jgi:hypothetical protein
MLPAGYKAFSITTSPRNPEGFTSGVTVAGQTALSSVLWEGPSVKSPKQQHHNSGIRSETHLGKL